MIFSILHSPFSSVHASLFAFLVFAAFSYPFNILPLGILFVVLLAVTATSSPKLSIVLPLPLKIAGILVCCCITAYSAYNILSLRSAYRDFSTAQMFYKAGAYNQAEKTYRPLYSSLKHEKKILFEYGQCLSKTGQYIEGNRIFEEYLRFGSDPMVYNCMGNNYKEMGEYAKAESMYIRASQIVPNRHYPLYLQMKLYRDTGREDEAKAAAHELLRKPVKVQSTAIREMQHEAKQIINN